MNPLPAIPTPPAQRWKDFRLQGLPLITLTFRLVGPDEKDRLLTTYWNIPMRQRETSVVLTRTPSENE